MLESRPAVRKGDAMIRSSGKAPRFTPDHPPETYLDTGELDGVPLRTLFDVQRDELDKCAEIARLAGGKPRRMFVYRGDEVHHKGVPIIHEQTGKAYASSCAAAIALKIPLTSILRSAAGRHVPSLNGVSFRIISKSVYASMSSK
jgi:hypothetical protein